MLSILTLEQSCPDGWVNLRQTKGKGENHLAFQSKGKVDRHNNHNGQEDQKAFTCYIKGCDQLPPQELRFIRTGP